MTDIRPYRPDYTTNMTTPCFSVRLAGLLLATVFCPAEAAEGRFLRLDAQGQPATANAQTWSCVLDQDSGLIWEVKTERPGLHQRDRTFRWAQTVPRHDEPPTMDCADAPCTTATLLQAVNQQGWCGAHDWRLPRREELRSLVDYRLPGPGPVLDTRYFPQTARQFYWSADPSAANGREAWGIGFVFGFDYAYPKDNRVHVRLVRDSDRP